MREFLRTALGVSLLVPGTVLAEASNFNYVEAAYLQGDIDGLDVDGWEVEGSVEVTEQVFLFADYARLELDEDLGFDAEADLQRIGAGYIFGENATGNFFGTLAYARVDEEASFGSVSTSDDDDGYSLGLGTRFNLGSQAEVRFGVNYTDLGEGDSLVTSAALVYNFAPFLAGVAEYSRDDDTDSIGLGVRFYFR